MIRFGADDRGRVFVTADGGEGRRARSRIRATREPLVMLKHFGPGNPDANVQAVDERLGAGVCEPSTVSSEQRYMRTSHDR